MQLNMFPRRVFFIALRRNDLAAFYVPVPPGGNRPFGTLCPLRRTATPLSVNLYMGVVHPPRSTYGSSVAPPALFEFLEGSDGATGESLYA
jgi:hypothetical protein